MRFEDQHENKFLRADMSYCLFLYDEMITYGDNDGPNR